LIAAGPGLKNAVQEAIAIAAVHPASLLLTGSRATVQRVLHNLEKADIAHVACHGSFRADNAQFSSLRLADGPLSAHELSSIGHYPRLCVLSACDLGLADAAGALGVAASLLTGGVSAVLASVLPADDISTATLMATFHRRLVAGEPAAVALNQARRALDDPLFGCGFTLYGTSPRIAPVDGGLA
jgi:CHAT domain-containing protein